MENFDVLVNLIGDALKRNYALYITRPYGNARVMAALIRKSTGGSITNVRELNFDDFAKRYASIFEELKDEDVTCVISFDKEREKYKTELQREVVKGLYGVDEYVDAITERVIYERSSLHGLNVLEIQLSDSLEEKKSGVMVKRKTRVGRKGDKK